MAGEAFISTWARCLGLNLEESSAERQRNAEEVEDLQKQLSKAAAEACLHWLRLALAMSHYGKHCMQGWQIDSLAGIDMKGMLGSFFDILSRVIPERIQTCTDSSIKESDQERQRSAEEVEDLRKQLSKAAAEACLHWLRLALAMSHYGKHCMQGWQIDSLAGIDMKGMLGSFFDILSRVIPERIETCTDSSIKESDQERQRSAEEVEDLRKQLSKAAAEACLHWLALAISHCVSLVFPSDSRTLSDVH